MSTTIQGIDARAHLVNWLQSVTGMYLADINAIPEDKWTATFGGCARPANELTADALALLMWTTEAINGNPATEGYGDLMGRLNGECATRASASAKFQEASQALAAALQNAGDATLSATITPPWQMPSPLFAIAQIAVSHIWYHDGQLNYIQCLLGDEKVHWMGD